MKFKRVVVTGMGMISPVGLSASQSWDAILQGQSGVSHIEGFDTTDFSVKIAAQVKGFSPEPYIIPKDLKKMDVAIQYGVVAAMQAWEDSGMTITDANARSVGVAVGSGIGGLSTMSATQTLMDQAGPKRVSPFFIPSTIINMISGNVAIRLGAKGPNFAIVTACTTGSHNIGYAARTIACGDADVMLAGGAEKASCALGIAGFASARALSKRNDDPTQASRPWDKDRDGFVLGDGAGVVVLESLEHAEARGAKIYAELVGFGMSADAYHMTLPDGDGALHAMKNALSDAQITPDQIDYINAHGTSTPAGDIKESQACEALLAEHAASVKISSTKSMIGHLLGAAGAVEAIFTVQAIGSQVAPPTINLKSPDEGCHLNYVPNQPQEGKIEYALSNSFGFGGTNASLIFKKF